jgi:hypothetical protein
MHHFQLALLAVLASWRMAEVKEREGPGCCAS